jgi:glycosyltransferase involved in cell wall biosynthesis
MHLSVILPTHNPHPVRFMRTLQALMRQSLEGDLWELIIVDNGSSPPVHLPEDPSFRSRVRLVREGRLGLTYARLAGVRECRGALVVFVDDDNVLANDYLEKVIRGFERLPRVGALGGKSVGEFEAPPAEWQNEFLGLLAVRDLGPKELFSLPPGTASPFQAYPSCAPIGAGMAVRKAALSTWQEEAASGATDRTGSDLTSGGDNEIVLHILRAGWAVAYLPELLLTHLIPAHRLEPEYLGRINRGIQKSWTQVLARHGLSPWPPVPPWTVPLRRWKAYVRERAWRDDASRIRWLGACGHFEGRASLPSAPRVHPPL